jgi:mono/diheme cytochrome c family protein
MFTRVGFPFPSATGRKSLGLAAILIAFACVRVNSISAGETKTIDFDRDVRPILSNHCFQCHGPDEARRKGKLRLDTAAGALGAGESGERAVVPGDPAASELYARITSTDPETQMPPAKTGKPLKSEDINRIKTWIESGASYKRHWAFDPPELVEVPKTRRVDWARNTIDSFILARLEQEGLEPSPEADRTTLLRRLSLDLIGLPPTIAEVDAFLADTSADAYEKQVDRLLASPHYGERWGRVWLDAARYADSDGFEKDKPREVWFYRDWVVSAFNRDLPYDRFVIEQLAGDLLENPTQDQIVATGYLRNSMINEEGGVDPEQFRMEAMFDRMDAIGKGILGLTIQCAQCHSHKYDPIGQDDYYRMFAFLNNCAEANVRVYTPDENRARIELLKKIRAIDEAWKADHPDWKIRMAEWEKRIAADQTAWTIVRPEVDDISTGGQKYLPLDDGSLLAQGYAPTKHTVKLTVRVDRPRVEAFRLELLLDANLPAGGPGRSIDGTCALTEFRVESAPANAPDKRTPVKFKAALADVNPIETELAPIFNDRSKRRRTTGPIALAIDGKDETAWGIDVGPGRSDRPREAIFVAEKPIENAGGTILTFYLAQNHGGWNSDDNQTNNLGRFRLSITERVDPSIVPVSPAIRSILAEPIEKRSAESNEAIFAVWTATLPERRSINDRIEALWRSHPVGASQLTLKESDRPRVTYLLERGDFLKPKTRVEPGMPVLFEPLSPAEPKNRLTLARRLVDRRSPTAARSIVNRIWQARFGTGIVSTSEDLGTQCDPPSHPELLDRLSVEFMNAGWSVKTLQKWISLSSTYRQSSRVAKELRERDPANRLLARGPRYRLDAEIARDVALAASGLLNEKIGGPSVHPPAPQFLFEPPVSYGPKVWRESTGSDRYRRSLYTFRYRSVPYPALQTFDAPNGDFACARRTRSNTPLQALVTLNEPIFMECARALARLTIDQGGADDQSRLEYAFRRTLARRPTEFESATLLLLFRRNERRFADPEAKPWEIAANDPAHPPELPSGESPARLAAWTVVARALLNLDETITLE